MNYKKAHEFYGRFNIPVADGKNFLFGIDYLVKDEIKEAIIEVEPNVYLNYVTNRELREEHNYIYTKIFQSPLNTKLGKALYKK
ncbi:MAG: hypothetical protein HC836_45290 [Richelia sp. RM2_1_2]|nr:hypothetical protein [Richelia sp. RM2_1_2]